MPTTIPLAVMSSQKFNTLLDDLRYTLQVRQATDSMLLVTIWRGLPDGTDEVLIQNVRAGHRTPLLPYRYLEDGGGNFWFETPNDELPTYTEFGGRHLLMYASNAELQEARGNA